MHLLELELDSVEELAPGAELLKQVHFGVFLEDVNQGHHVGMSNVVRQVRHNHDLISYHGQVICLQVSLGFVGELAQGLHESDITN